MHTRLALVLLIAFMPWSVWAAPPEVSSLKGVCLSGGYSDIGQLVRLRVSHAKNWGISLSLARLLAMYGIEYHPSLLLDCEEVRPESPEFVAMVEEFAIGMPGSEWYLFNEPELASQHPVGPERAVELFDEIREILLNVDPDATFVIGNVTFTEEGQAWLDSFLSYYRDTHNGVDPPIAGIGLHVYADFLDNRGPGEFLEMLDDSRQYAKGLGYAPIYTEWGFLYPRFGESVEGVMEAGSFWFTVGGYVHFWYATCAASDRWCPQCAGSLFEKGECTTLAELFRELPRPVLKVYIADWHGDPSRLEER